MNIFSVNFWMQTFVTTFATLCCIYLIKKATSVVDIPVVSDIAAAV